MKWSTHFCILNDPLISLPPLNSRRIWTISQFVFRGNSCPVRLMKYLHCFSLSSSLIHVSWAWTTEISPHFTSCRILGMKTLGKQLTIRCRMLNVASGVWKMKYTVVLKVMALLWRDMSPKAFQITGNSNVCPIVKAKISNLYITKHLWGKFVNDISLSNCTYIEYRGLLR